MKSVSIIMPVFNEAKTVRTTLDAVVGQPLPQDLHKEVIIVESCSNDGSRELLQEYVQNRKLANCTLRLILQDAPRGKGHAVREGLESATGDIVLIQDADLEYDVADYPALIEPILKGYADFVLGSRHLSAGNWKIRKFEKSPWKAIFMNLGGTFFHTLFNRVYGVKLTDPTTMYKVFLRECVRGVEFQSNRFDFDWELVAKLVRLGYVPLEVPISYRSRGFEDGKKINIWRDPWTYLRAIFRFRFQRIRRIPRAVLPGAPRNDQLDAVRS